MKSARTLVTLSYRQSAERVLLGLSGNLIVCNKRSEAPAWNSTAEIVGLCGQGGRHPYFRIPVSALHTAATRLRSLDPIDPNALQEVMLTSQLLRAATVFDDRTGCTNDRLPILVPLLPPEEIWFDGHEMPSDVWRLLFAETDTLAVAVAADIDIADVALGGLSYSSLAFADLMRSIGNCTVEFGLTEKALPAPFAGTLKGKDCRVSLRRLFFEAGCLLTPIKTHGVARWSVAARYADWIHRGPSSSFCIDRVFRHDSIDARFRGLFAEEMAVGMMAVVLQDYFGCHLINNTVEVLGQRPAGVRADFIAEGTSAGKPHAIVVESKGSVHTAVSKSRREQAKKQVANTSHPHYAPQDVVRLTCCSTIRYSDQKARSVCDVWDPPFEPEPGFPEGEPTTPAYWWRSAFARTLRFVGLDAASEQVLRGQPVTLLGPAGMSVEGGYEGHESRAAEQRRRISKSLDAEVVMGIPGGCVVVDRAVLSALRDGLSDNSYENVRTNVMESRHRRFPDRGSRREREGGSRRETFLTGLGIGLALYDEFE
jgi:hypothetical protein